MSSFTHAGVSRLNGKVKVRYANGKERVKVLIKNGHKDIDLIEVRHAMTKEEAVAYLLLIDFDDGNTEVRAALEAEAKKRGVDIPVKPVDDNVVEFSETETDAALEAAA